MGEKFCVYVSVTCRNQEVNGAKAIIWTHQIELSVQCQIAQVDGPKLSEGNETAERLVIFSEVDAGLWREGATIWIRCSLALQRCLDHLRGGRHHPPIHAGNRNLIARFGDSMFRFAVKLAICTLQKSIGVGIRLGVRTVVDQLFDRNPRR